MPSKIQSLEPSSSMITLLPNDIITDILARLPRCNYPYLSLVSKHFYSIVTSPEIYARRSLLGCTEACIYSVIHDQKTNEYCLYNLCRKANNNNCFVFISSLRGVPSLVNFFSGGSKIYALGGVYNHPTSLNGFSFDCRSHKMQSLPSMPMRMIYTVADVIDGKIYIIGRCKTEKKKNVMLVFNTETQMWESEMTKLDMEWGYIWSRGSVVIEDKMYMKNYMNSFVYMPKENKLETDEMLNMKNWENACVIDDILYYFDSLEKKLRAYDSKLRRWGVVKGLNTLFDGKPNSLWSNTVNYGDKLVLLFTRCDSDSRIWWAEIALERRQGEEIWGNVESCDAVVEGRRFSLVKSLVVMV